MRNLMEIRASFEWQFDTIALRMGFREPLAFVVAQPAVFAPLLPDAAESAPLVRLQREEAQALMDQLWACGIRPAEGNGSAGAMTAAQAHLQDMRTIALGLLKTSGKLP